jgi:hypothetical protein
MSNDQVRHGGSGRRHDTNDQRKRITTLNWSLDIGHWSFHPSKSHSGKEDERLEFGERVSPERPLYRRSFLVT